MTGMSCLIVSHYFSASADYGPPWKSFKINICSDGKNSLWNQKNLGLNPSFPCGSFVILENLLNLFELWFADLYWGGGVQILFHRSVLELVEITCIARYQTQYRYSGKEVTSCHIKSG